MHVSRQPNTERWVQSNSPFSLVLRDHVDSKLTVAWSKLLAKAMPVKSWRLRVRLTERTMRWRSRWVRAWLERVSDLDQCQRVRRWVRAWECASALCKREGEGEWEWRVICVRWVRRYFWKYPIWREIIVYSQSTINAYSLLSHGWWVPLIKFMMGPTIHVRERSMYLLYSGST